MASMLHDVLKDKARHHYLAFLDIAENYDCGNELVKTINSDAAVHAREFNTAMDELAQIDTSCPKDRL